jgi:hypothetical protein
MDFIAASEEKAAKDVDLIPAQRTHVRTRV